MRIILYILIFSLPSICLGQNYELMSIDNERYFKILKDSINLNYTYPDGRYKVFNSDTSNSPAHIFNLTNGMVNGPYLNLGSCGWNIGNYQLDSLWTFITNPEDTTFKIGAWRRYICGLDINENDSYKIPFDTNGIFEEVWQFSNGNFARQALYQKGKGLLKETYWDYVRNKVWKEIIHSKSDNFSHTIVYENDSISSVYIVQDGVEISIDYDYPLINDKPLIEIQIYKEEQDNSDLPIASLSLDSNKVVTDFVDIQRQIFLRENENSNMTIEYKSKKGRWKEKTLKIK